MNEQIKLNIKLVNGYNEAVEAAKFLDSNHTKIAEELHSLDDSNLENCFMLWYKQFHKLIIRPLDIHILNEYHGYAWQLQACIDNYDTALAGFVFNDLFSSTHLIMLGVWRYQYC